MVYTTGLRCVLVLGLAVTSSGQCVGALAGAPPHLPEDDASAIGAQLAGLQGAVADPSNPGNIYLTLADRLLLVDRNRTITLVAGGKSSPPRDSLIATDATLTLPYVSVGATGRVIVADKFFIREFLPASGELVVLAGNASGGIADGLPGTLSQVSAYCINVAPSGDIFYCDGVTVRVLRMSGLQSGRVFTVAGNGSSALSVNGALATQTGLSTTYDVFCEQSGDLLIADNDEMHPRILRVSGADGRIRAIAGTATASFSGTWFADGSVALETALPGAWTVCSAAPSGTVYFSDSQRVIRISSDGKLYVLAGQTPTERGASRDGAPFSSSGFSGVGLLRTGVSDKEIILTTAYDASVYRLDLEAKVVHFEAGILHNAALSEQASSGALATLAVLDTPSDFAYDHATGDVFIAVSIADMIIRVHSADGTLRSVISSSNITAPGLAYPTCVALDGKGGVVICDHAQCLVRRVALQTGKLETLAGNETTLCSIPPTTYDTIANASADPSYVVHNPRFAAVDFSSGDIYWTEDVALRIMVYRTGTSDGAQSRVFRIAGNGQLGPASVGSLALNSPLQEPLGIALDPVDGSVVFIDAPSSVLRVLHTGMLEAVALLQHWPTVPLDGSFVARNASAVGLYGLSFDVNGRDLYVTDVFSAGSVVRFIDLSKRTISTVAGTWSGFGVRPDGATPPLNTSFQSIVAVKPFDGGNMLALDRGTGVLYSIVSNVTAVTFCPAGYFCPCGTPLPCTNPSQYCLTNELKPREVPRGLYAVGSAVSNTSSVVIYGSVAGCPVGSFCINGSKFMCWPGSFGIAALQATPSGCALCPAGTYSPSFGSTSAKNCRPCPPGYFSASAGSAFCSACPSGTASSVTGADSPNACTVCRSCSSDSGASVVNSSCSLVAFPGSVSCFHLGSTSVAAGPAVMAFQDIVPAAIVDSDDRTVRTDVLIIAILVPLISLAIFPTCILIMTRRCRGRATNTCYACCQHAWMRSKQCLRMVDLYSLRHTTAEGSSPVKHRTSVGGTFSIIGSLLVTCLIVVLIIQFKRSNSLVSTSLRPAELPTLYGYASLPTFAYTSEPPSVAPPSLKTGLELRISVMGSTCSSPIAVSMPTLTRGGFKVSVARRDSTVEFYEHLFSCPDCAFDAASILQVTFAEECTAFIVTVATVGAAGSTYVSSTVVESPSSIASDTGRVLTSSHITVVPQLQVLANHISGVVVRGYSVSVSTVNVVTVPSTLWPRVPVVLSFLLQTSDTFVLTEVVPIVSPTQLVSSIVGLFGLLGAFGQLFALLEYLCLADSRRHEGASRFPSPRLARIMKPLGSFIPFPPSPQSRPRVDGPPDETKRSLHSNHLALTPPVYAGANALGHELDFPDTAWTRTTSRSGIVSKHVPYRAVRRNVIAPDTPASRSTSDGATEIPGCSSLSP